MTTELHSSFDLDQLLARITGVRAAVVGDFCLDAYWEIDPDEKLTSVETGLPVRAVRSQRYSPGGAGNVVANLIDLGVADVKVIGLVGADLFGDELRRLLVARGADVSGLLRASQSWQTHVYAKPYTAGTEGNRMDFGCFNQLGEEMARQVEAAIARAAVNVDVVILNQQFARGLCSQQLAEAINRVIHLSAKTRFVVDSRDFAHLYHRGILKLNVREAARLLGIAATDAQVCTSEACQYAQRIWDKTRQPVFLTRGENGMIVADAGGVTSVPGVQIIEQIDPVGAGDTAVAALAAALGCGATPLAAATLANIAASVTVRKLQTTGTATPTEIKLAGDKPDYIYNPDLASDARKARYIDGTSIEWTGSMPTGLQIQHAIFDHDGTLSVLREGWEQIMQPMMIRAVLGERFNTIDSGTFERVESTVREFIDKTTGIQTLVQMKGLVSLVRQFGFVPADKVLDEHGYKRIYNDSLLQMVHERVRRLKNGELCSEDFQIKNAARLLKELHDRGVKLYLASGTDKADVIAEAEAMGYAHLFDGRIFGAVGDVKVEAKRIVLERIIAQNNLRGSQFATFGDGPVEMRETYKRGGICIGVASDELRRFGLNPAKRARLIRAGAMLIVPDFGQLDALLKVLNFK